MQGTNIDNIHTRCDFCGEHATRELHNRQSEIYVRTCNECSCDSTCSICGKTDCEKYTECNHNKWLKCSAVVCDVCIHIWPQCYICGYITCNICAGKYRELTIDATRGMLLCARQCITRNDYAGKLSDIPFDITVSYYAIGNIQCGLIHNYLISGRCEIYQFMGYLCVRYNRNWYDADHGYIKGDLSDDIIAMYDDARNKMIRKYARELCGKLQYMRQMFLEMNSYDVFWEILHAYIVIDARFLV